MGIHASERGIRRGWCLAATVVLALVFTFGQAAVSVAETYDPDDPWALPPETVQKGIKTGDFQNPDVCARCHPGIYQDWTKSMHRQYGNPAFQWAFEEASKDTQGKVDGFCPRCHSPIAVLGGEKVAPGRYKQLSEIAQKGVQCDFCHTLEAVSPDWPGNGSYKVSPGSTKRGPLKDAVSPYHKTRYSALYDEAAFCGMCHNLSHPGTKLQLEATYSEWLNSQYAEKGITCQDCHMPTSKGQAATKGPVREVNSHKFVGGNVRGAQRDTAIQILKDAATVELETPGDSVDYGSQITFTAKVRNKGAGHYLPTGITELRQMWLEFRITDSAGRVVYSRDHMFNTVLEDANGVHDGTVPIWRATKVYSDTRIAPNTTSRLPITWKVPRSLTKGDVKVTAELKYRSLPEEFAAAAKLSENPTTLMAAAEPLDIKVTSTAFGWVLGVFTTGVLGGSFIMPIVVLIVWFVFTVWLVVVTIRARSKPKADDA